ncbi:uncharacterized protein LOC117189753 isoform X1 [Drosophila miranda]|uniref:uncharacterized protein LOC117189753 isoform X1 n=1 Tax=Drosophila miranda TaxID=7229 RepID=UPI00143F6991|nr:uncharacterized protein LOC117189753 isoform X1 [Drosophila miranda]
MLLRTCCGCCSLKYGCFLVAIYTGLTYSLQLVTLLMYGLIEEYAESQIFYLFLSVPCTIAVAVSVALFVGALKKRARLLWPWLITFSVFTIIFVLTLIGSLIAGSTKSNVEDNHVGSGFMRRPLVQALNLREYGTTQWILDLMQCHNPAVIHLYVLLVVYSHYSELQNENIF